MSGSYRPIFVVFLLQNTFVERIYASLQPSIQTIICIPKHQGEKMDLPTEESTYATAPGAQLCPQSFLCILQPLWIQEFCSVVMSAQEAAEV